jgi:hypothetical protein
MVLEARLAKLRARLAHSPALVLVRLDHVASLILNGNHKILLFSLSSRRSPCSEKP